jgi:hypothetical protein
VQDKAFGVGAVFGFQARAGTGDDVFAIKGTVPAAELDQTESLFHGSLQYGRERIRAKKDCAGFAPASAGIRRG